METKGIKLICLASCLLGSFIATAGTMGEQAPVAARGEFGFSAGYYNAESGRAQHINIVDLVGNNYGLNKKNDGNYLLGLGYMVNGWDYNPFNLAFGVKAFYLGETEVNGVIDMENIYSNLSYQYNVTHIPIYAMARATLNSGNKNFGLVIDGGIGPNIMTTRNYTEASLDGGITLLDNSFSGHTQTKFSATAGVGLKFNNLMNVSGVEIGYRFFYLGQGDLQATNNMVLNNLQTRDIYANAIVLTISI